ncbi:LysR family transcriptional regulator ArgP [Ideonella dechloratans]|uniref:LysR family transcriptional regulator ArgP n=1 Tax=Ideonella dechloratans TaxID=36863 RepID=A0A643FGB8_IDEDE|nr:LysR family transcriptional regulator ArgP [Ideonella dechloratans]KAB0584442.1 LysR family transcriptional regulator ArgP [Ideonella dechloratans]UFU10882.1 LysR family transcriptional regulator ArgP [Ideonella dechloratans]
MNALDPAGLECLAALAEAGSFDGAAQLLHITQSAVSQRLRSLESNVGHVLVVRERPLRLTEPGKVLLRYARQMQVLRADAARELGATLNRDERLPIAVNPNSLATWVLPALDPLVQRGLQEGFGVELIVDDQDFTHDWLRQGEVLGCVSTVAQALRGCACQALGAMRYVAAASPAFVARHLPQGLNRRNFAQLPFVTFNRKDDMQTEWVAKAFGVRDPQLRERFVPSSEAVARAAAMGWGVSVLPELLARPLLASGALLPVLPEVHLDVTLYWHQWKLSGEDGEVSRHGLMDQIGAALLAGARQALHPVPMAGGGDNPAP